MDFEKYSEIEGLYRNRDAILQCDEVIITEKIDGTNMRIALIDEKFRIGGRNMEFPFENPQGDMGFVAWCQEHTVEQRLRSLGLDNIIVYGEFCGEKINVPIYGKGRNFLIFDIKLEGKYVDWDQTVELAKKLGFSVVPILYRGKPSLEIFNQLRRSISGYAKLKTGKEYSHEGIVIKPTKTTYTREGYLVAKYKDALFEERRSVQEGKDPIIKTGYDYAYEFVTPERLKHVIAQMKEANVYKDSFECLHEMVWCMVRDIIEKEGKPEFEKLSDKQKNAARKIIAKFTQEEFQNYLVNPEAGNR